MCGDHFVGLMSHLQKQLHLEMRVIVRHVMSVSVGSVCLYEVFEGLKDKEHSLNLLN